MFVRKGIVMATGISALVSGCATDGSDDELLATATENLVVAPMPLSPSTSPR